MKRRRIVFEVGYEPSVDVAIDEERVKLVYDTGVLHVSGPFLCAAFISR